MNGRLAKAIRKSIKENVDEELTYKPAGYMPTTNPDGSLNNTTLQMQYCGKKVAKQLKKKAKKYARGY